ncbi:UNKNOWN [Stylonychia lemnae]|uniref:Uncharacterized protein n=1 Tax=Stylonychia lemnae TaxID=5949 RepID=A0A077ZVF4_STYLE|nr:UNKNOWN [Stylonychia lemnae]|eukprot:CDW73834.1 UNKNOWN [Stylonychia lemnae]
MDSIEKVIDEKNELWKALQDVQELLERTKNEKEQVTKLFADFKQHFEVIKTQCSQYHNRLVEEITSKKEIQNIYEQRLQDLRKSIEVKQREIDQISQKMVLPIDTDILRMRIQKDLESKFRIELETRALELERMTDAFYECKRHMEIFKTSLENQKFESEKILQEMREKHKNELTEIYEENQSLQIKLEEQRDRETIRQIRRELDEFRKRASDQSLEINELRKERDALKLERNDMIIKQAKELEDERNTRRTLNTDNDKLKFRVRCLEDDLQKQCLKSEKKTQELNQTSNEKTSLLGLMKEKEIQMDSMNRQMNELREELHQRELDLDMYLRRQTDEERDKGIMERKEKSKLQRELEILEKNYTELEQQRKADIYAIQDDYEKLQKQHRVMTEERNIYLQKVQQVQTEFDDMRKTFDQKNDEFDMIEREYKKLQERHRETMNNEFNLQTAKDHLEMSVRVSQEELQKVNQEFEESVYRWKQERGELLNKLQEFQSVISRARDESAKSKLHSKQYKDKLRLANNTIRALSQKVAQYELERQAERDIDDIRVGSQQLMENGLMGRDSHNSNRGSDVDFKEVIQRILHDDQLKQEMRKILNQ